VERWNEAVLYEIYVRSFRDTDGDGIGDLAGVLEKLGYVAELGVDAVWLTPIHPSPDADLGYDVADYTAVDPRLGTLDALDRLLADAHDRGLQVLLDLVVNHTSDRHPWFTASRASRDGPWRDWYIWRPGPPDAPPTNWRSIAGGSAWRHDAASGGHYLHTFLPEQPDLNWRNPAVRAAIADAMRFWLDRGADGFRLDALPLLIKDDRFGDNPPNPDWRPGESDYRRVTPALTVDQPEMADVIAFLRSVLDEYPHRVLVAEMGLPPARAARYHVAIHVPFNFGLITEPWTAPRLHRRIAAHLDALPDGASPNWVLGNHDVHRLASRLGPRRARVAAVIGLTLPGTVTLYYGDELGLTDSPLLPDVPRDGFGRLDPARSRDPARAPMPWDGSRHGGFSAAEPWLPAYPDAAAVGVAAQRDDPSSCLALYRRLLALRRMLGWAGGPCTGLRSTDSELAYDREVEGRQYRVVARLEDGDVTVPLPAPGRVLLSACEPHPAEAAPVEAVTLAGPDAVVVALTPD
jgi:alpha-glucosidase